MSKLTSREAAKKIEDFKLTRSKRWLFFSWRWSRATGKSNPARLLLVILGLPMKLLPPLEIVFDMMVFRERERDQIDGGSQRFLQNRKQKWASWNENKRELFYAYNKSVLRQNGFIFLKDFSHICCRFWYTISKNFFWLSLVVIFLTIFAF